jgi:ketosteroid isomerase-like protein
MAEPLEVADRLFAAIEAGDIDAVRELYHPDIAVWHNTGGLAQ